MHQVRYVACMKNIFCMVAFALSASPALSQVPRLDCLVKETIVFKEGSQPQHIAPAPGESFTFQKISAGQLRVNHQIVQPFVYTVNITKNDGTKLGGSGMGLGGPVQFGIDQSTPQPTFAVQTFATSTGATVLKGGSCSWVGGTGKW